MNDPKLIEAAKKATNMPRQICETKGLKEPVTVNILRQTVGAITV